MYSRKSRRNSQTGLDPSTYYNTRDDSNTPVVQVEGTTDKLPPTPVSPVSPDITPVSPRVTPIQPQPGGMMPLFGVTGKVYVILTRPMTTEAIVVVEVTNDDMLYDKTIDKQYLGKLPNVATLSYDVNHVNIQAAIDLLAQIETTATYIDRSMAQQVIDYLSPYSVLLQTDGVVEQRFATSAATTVTAGFNRYPSGELTCYTYTGELDYEDTTLSSMSTQFFDNNAPPNYYANLVTTRWGKYPVRSLSDEVAKTNKRTFTVETRMIIILELKVNDTHVTFIAEALYKLSVRFHVFGEPGHPGCPPKVDPTSDETHVWKDTIKWVRREAYSNKQSNVKVKRAYTNIGGKLTYLYTVPVDATTEVLVNYDGGSYGLVVNLTEDDPDTGQPVTKRYTVSSSSLVPDASFVNNVNDKGLNAANQTALQPVLQQPVDVDEEYDANIPTASTFKAYGFEPIFRQPDGAYNDITIKGAAVL